MKYNFETGMYETKINVPGVDREKINVTHKDNTIEVSIDKETYIQYYNIKVPDGINPPKAKLDKGQLIISFSLNKEIYKTIEVE